MEGTRREHGTTEYCKGDRQRDGRKMESEGEREKDRGEEKEKERERDMARGRAE